MRKELSEKLFDRFDFYRPELPMEQSLMCFGFGCDDGWFDLIWELSEELEKLDKRELEKITEDQKAKMLLENKKLSTINVSQVKEKFGTLRFYIDSGTNEMFDLIEKYEKRSALVCEKCGLPGWIRPGGWMQALCNSCVNYE